MSQHETYDEVFRDRFGIHTWIPAWRPGADLRLGMAGRIRDGEFVYEYDLKDRGVALPVPPPPDTRPDEYQWSTEGGVDISVKAAGETDTAFKAVAAADVGFRISFTSSDAMAMVYRDVREQRLGDERAIAEQMVRAWNGGSWPKMQIGDVAVTQLLVAGWGFAFGASAKGAEVVLRADAGLGSPGASLGNVTGKVGVSWQESTSFAALSVDGGLVIGFRGLELVQEGFIFKQTVAKPIFKALEAEPLVLAREDFPEGSAPVLSAG
ncbi:MAG: hypothetical protein AB1416_12080 [Actinomycetota bacterium]